MSQSARGYDSVLESDDLMSWLLFDFDHGVQSEKNGTSEQALSTTILGSDFDSGLDGSLHIGDETSEFPLSALESSSGDHHHEAGLSSHFSSSSLRKSGRTLAASSSSSIGKKRPRESVDDLEVRVKELQAENADLHAHLLNVTQRTTEVQRQRTDMERLMLEKLMSTNEEEQAELAGIVKKYTDIYADYGKCRQREVSFHLQQIEKLIIPTNTTKLCLWALQQDKSFFQKNKSPLYDLLSKELELTGEQTLKFQERREKTLELLAQLRESLELLKMLKGSIEKKHEVYDRICGLAQSAATPKQTVKFLMWITRHADILSKYIPGFTRNVHHIPNAEFVEGEQASSITPTTDTADSSE